MPPDKPPARKRPSAAAPSQPGKSDRTDPGSPPPEAVLPGPGDATLVYDKNKGRARGGSPLLVAVAGPRKGSEFPLIDERTTIGRGSDNVLVIPDISVSRQHVIVQREGDRWVVVDQGSGNGTRLNGRGISRQALRHGDEIAMGDTVVQFVEPGGVMARGAKPVPADALRTQERPEITSAKAAPQSALKRRAPLYFAIFGALLIAFGAGVVRKQKLDRARRESAQGDDTSALAQQRFQEGVTLLKQGKWVEARDKLKIAAELDGSDADIARYLETAQAEAPRAQALSAARAALARKDFAAARTSLQGIPEDSALAEFAHEVDQQVRAALDAAVRDARVRAESGDAAGASEALAPVLAADPSRADALAVKEVIGPQRRAVAQAPAPRRERAEKAAPAPAASSETAPVLDAYLSGDIGSALERAALAPGAQRLLGQLQQFDDAYKDGVAKMMAHKTNEALKALETAARADAAIAGSRESRLGREVKKSLSSLHYQLGIATVQTDEGLPQAATHLRAAIAADSGNDLAQQQLAQVVERAKELYLRGYVAKDSDADTARHSFKIVIETLPPGDETAQKAKRWLDKLNGKAPKEDG
jgi:pSer/pThr/pTyr-binding forkhead associated (FHA) protein